MAPKRITEREVAEGEDARLAVQIGSLRVGTLEGVRIDFRHPDIPADWEPLPWWNVWGAPPSSAGIIFPSEASFGIAELRKHKGMGADQAGVYARPGDRVVVERVEIIEEGREFYHEHDKFVRLAHLRIERNTGEVLRPPGPLAFYGISRLVRHGSREAFDHIVERSLLHAGASAFPRRSFTDFRSPWQLPIEETVLFFAGTAHADYFKLVALLHGLGAAEGRALMHLRSLANNAALAGFLLAKVEALEPENKATGQRERARRTGKARADAELLAAAQRLAQEHPKWSRNRITTALLQDFPNKSASSVNRSLKRANVGPAQPV